MLGIVDGNAIHGVTWVHSYVTTDRMKTYCIYDAPDPEAIRSAAGTNSLPVERISEVRVLDPYFYVEPRSRPRGDTPRHPRRLTHPGVLRQVTRHR
jgi:Protein of unknown function (DUF4242)